MSGVPGAKSGGSGSVGGVGVIASGVGGDSAPDLIVDHKGRRYRGPATPAHMGFVTGIVDRFVARLRLVRLQHRGATPRHHTRGTAHSRHLRVPDRDDSTSPPMAFRCIAGVIIGLGHRNKFRCYLQWDLGGIARQFLLSTTRVDATEAQQRRHIRVSSPE